MNSRLLLTMLASATLASGHIILANNASVIKDASYKVCDGENELGPHGTPCSGKQVTFYTYDGNPLKRVDVKQHDCWKITKAYALDPSAPRPQPVFFQIKYWPAFRIYLTSHRKGRFKKFMARLFFGTEEPYVTKGCPGDFIIFYDKHGNKIKKYRFNREANEVTVFSGGEGPPKVYSLDDKQDLKDFPLDLSEIECYIQKRTHL